MEIEFRLSGRLKIRAQVIYVRIFSGQKVENKLKDPTQKNTVCKAMSSFSTAII